MHGLRSKITFWIPITVSACLAFGSVLEGEDPRPWRMGDCNRDGFVDLSDASTLMGYLFTGADNSCEALCDLDGDGRLLVTDCVILLDHLFRASFPDLPEPPPVPREICDGIDNDCDGCLDEFCPRGDTGGALPLQLTWDPVTTDVDGHPERLAGYRLHIGTAPGRYCEVLNVGDRTQIGIGGLRAGVRYYFVVTAVDRAGNESAHSNEITARAIPR